MSSTTTVASDIDLLLDEIQDDTNSGELPAYQPQRRTVASSVSTAPSGSATTPSAPSLTSISAFQITTSTAKILIVDDDQFIVTFCQSLLWELGYENCISQIDSTRAMATILAERPDLIILDVMMPGLSGVDLLRVIRGHEELTHVPVLILTASSDRTTKATVLELGATDLLTKPIDLSELAPRVRNALTIKKYHDGLRDYARTLEEAVRARTADLESSRMDVVHCLARAVEYRDDHTGRHVERVGRYAGLIGEAMSLEAETCRMLQLAAQLHDVGKIGVSDDVLLKPGRLTPEEYERMQRHTLFGKKIVEQMSDRDWEKMRQHVQIGSKILEAPRSPLLAMAARIALTHHERWDGTGYPLGLAGEDIPLEGRVTAVADVFDALSSRRPYKPAFSLEKCFEIIEQERGSHFDPKVIDAFFSRREQIVQTQIELADPQ